MKAGLLCPVLMGFRPMPRLSLAGRRRRYVGAGTRPPGRLSSGGKRNLQDSYHHSAGQGIASRLVPNFLPFDKIEYPRAFEGCRVNEDILSAVIRRDVSATPF